MRSAILARHPEPSLGVARAATTDAAARDQAAAHEDVMECDQSLPVPWEWWTPSPATN